MIVKFFTRDINTLRITMSFNSFNAKPFLLFKLLVNTMHEFIIVWSCGLFGISIIEAKTGNIFAKEDKFLKFYVAKGSSLY